MGEEHALVETSLLLAVNDGGAGDETEEYLFIGTL